jgi:hypothetical protein
MPLDFGEQPKPFCLTASYSFHKGVCFMDLSSIGSLLSEHMTKEVMTVLTGLVLLYVGFKAAAKSWGFVAGTMKKISFMGAVATCMLFGGLGRNRPFGRRGLDSAYQGPDRRSWA